MEPATTCLPLIFFFNKNCICFKTKLYVGFKLKTWMFYFLSIKNSRTSCASPPEHTVTMSNLKSLAKHVGPSVHALCAVVLRNAGVLRSTEGSTSCFCAQGSLCPDSSSFFHPFSSFSFLTQINLHLLFSLFSSPNIRRFPCYAPIAPGTCLLFRDYSHCEHFYLHFSPD